MSQQTFIIDCPFCKAKVAAVEEASVTNTWDSSETIYDGPDLNGIRLVIGSCPKCNRLLVGEAEQVDFAGWDADEDRWSNVFVRVYPSPQKKLLSQRIPKSVAESLDEADRSLQANANMASCVMLGRALESVCRDTLGTKITLGKGVDMLKERGIIDSRLYDWSQQLRVFRNLAAHADTDAAISRQDAEDLQSFVYAIIEYIYDLTDKYNKFKERIDKKSTAI